MISPATGDDDFCEYCGRKLNPDRIKWLELNCKTGQWSDPDRITVPGNESQGLFPFGIACARRRLMEDNR